MFRVPDPEITVRRKTVFLLGTLLLPTTPSAPSTSQPGLHVPSTPSPDQPAQPVFDNSHAAYIHDPSRASTSQLTHEALQTYGIIGAVISALTDPLPFGEDGDSSGADPAFEEQGIRFVPCRLAISILTKNRSDCSTHMWYYAGASSRRRIKKF